MFRFLRYNGIDGVYWRKWERVTRNTNAGFLWLCNLMCQRRLAFYLNFLEFYFLVSSIA